jgi:hypothetical protein
MAAIVREIFHDSIECQARLRTIPLNKLVNRVTISSLSFRGSKTVEYCRFQMFQIGEPWTDLIPFRLLARCSFLFMIGGLRAADRRSMIKGLFVA